MGAITVVESPEGARAELIQSPKFDVGMYSIGCDVNDLGEVLAEVKQRGCEPTFDRVGPRQRCPPVLQPHWQLPR